MEKVALAPFRRRPYQRDEVRQAEEGEQAKERKECDVDVEQKLNMRWTMSRPVVSCGKSVVPGMVGRFGSRGHLRGAVRGVEP